MTSMLTDQQSGILYRQWKAASPRAVFLLVHGMGGHSARWDFLAEYFLQKGISSYGIELKGWGETSDLRGHIDSFQVYYNDIVSLYRIISSDNPDKPVFILGESMGGLISFMTAALYPHLFNGLICMVPSFANAMKFTPGFYAQSLFAAAFNRRKQFTVPFNAKMCTQDVEYQKVMDADKAREHRLATAGLLFGILIQQMRSQSLKDKITMPVLFQVAGNDLLVSSEAIKKTFKGLKAQDKKIIEYPGMLHALSIESGRQKVFEDVWNWLEPRL